MFNYDLGFDALFGDSHPFLRDFDDAITEIALLSEPAKFTQVIFLEYASDFNGFCLNVLGVKLSADQVKMGRMVEQNPRFAVAACYGSGKTFWLACLVLWWLWTRRPCLAVSTAPTGRQVRELLWAEITKIHLAAKVPLGGKILVRETRISPDRRGLGFSGDKPNSVAGYHERENVLFAEDESAGMKRNVVEGFEGLTITPGSRHVKVGNTVATEGPFWDCWNCPKQSLRWATYQISAYSTPNVTGKGAMAIGFAPVPGLACLAAWRTVAESVAHPGLVSYDWVRERELRWGNEHPLFVSRVLGRWYLVAGGKVVVPTEWVQAAIQRHKEHLEGGSTSKVWGVDVGGGDGGDYTTVYERFGRKPRRVAAWNQGSIPDQADRLAALAEKQKCQVLNIDATGGFGKTLYDCLRRLKRDGRLVGVTINKVVCNRKSTEPEETKLVVDQLWWAMRKAFDPSNPEAIGIDERDRELVEELPKRTWSMEGSEEGGCIRIESKREMRLKRGIASPDSADGLSLTFFKPPTERCFAA